VSQAVKCFSAHPKKISLIDPKKIPVQVPGTKREVFIKSPYCPCYLGLTTGR
jgi:hypothetical protein